MMWAKHAQTLNRHVESLSMTEEYFRTVFIKYQEIEMNPKKKPKFLRQGTYLKKVKKVWRRPRGVHSKLKVHEKSKGSLPNVGYGAPKKMRRLHPSGLKEVMVYNLTDIENINKEKEAGRLSSGIGQKKKKIIVERAKQLKIRILNP